MIIHLIVGLIMKILYYKMSYFPEPYTHSKSKVKVEYHLSSYATKSDVKNVAGVNTAHFAKKADLASLKSDVDDLASLKSEVLII